ncbi:MAG: class II aldolase/adducin family protein [Deltaproteobacteria bacterium]|nr:class II aldolase/adducin family protein [Deltaproteobacteria bacterium]
MAPSSQSQLIAVCQKIGSEIPRWTQGAGGNVSVKEDGLLWIKATGVRLDSVSHHFGLAEVDQQRLECGLVALPDGDEEGYRSVVQGAARVGRPSMETGFHALSPARWVMHFHSLPAILMFQRFLTDPKAVTAWARHQPLSMAWVGIKTPGLELSRTLEKTRAEVVVLQNHGVVIQCFEDTPLERLATFREMEEDFCAFWGYGQNRKEMRPALRAVPLKAYFPDVAVFQDRILGVVEVSGPYFRLRTQAESIDRDAVEIFEAIQWLYRECPLLTELPIAMATKLPELPFEKLRRGH